MFKRVIALVICLILLTGCSSQADSNVNEKLQGQQAPIETLNEEIEARAAEDVALANYNARYKDFDLDAYIKTTVCGNAEFLKYVAEGQDYKIADEYISSCYDSFKNTISKDSAKWAEFISAGGSAEVGVEFYDLIQECHYYYTDYMHRFENDEDTCFLDKNIVEAFATVGVGIDWIVPRSMESTWGETRHQKTEVTLVRVEGIWYVVGL